MSDDNIATQINYETNERLASFIGHAVIERTAAEARANALAKHAQAGVDEVKRLRESIQEYEVDLANARDNPKVDLAKIDVETLQVEMTHRGFSCAPLGVTG